MRNMRTCVIRSSASTFLITGHNASVFSQLSYLQPYICSYISGSLWVYHCVHTCVRLAAAGNSSWPGLVFGTLEAGSVDGGRGGRVAEPSIPPLTGGIIPSGRGNGGIPLLNAIVTFKHRCKWHKNIPRDKCRTSGQTASALTLNKVKN